MFTQELMSFCLSVGPSRLSKTAYFSAVDMLDDRFIGYVKLGSASFKVIRCKKLVVGNN